MQLKSGRVLSSVKLKSKSISIDYSKLFKNEDIGMNWGIFEVIETYV